MHMRNKKGNVNMYTEVRINKLESKLEEMMKRIEELERRAGIEPQYTPEFEGERKVVSLADLLGLDKDDDSPTNEQKKEEL